MGSIKNCLISCISFLLYISGLKKVYEVMGRALTKTRERHNLILKSNFNLVLYFMHVFCKCAGSAGIIYNIYLIDINR